jgi:hypothetical protein
MRNNKPFQPAWNTAIFDRIIRDWTRMQKPLSSLEIKLAVRAIVGPEVQVLQHEISTLLRITFGTRKDKPTIDKVGSYFALYESREERDANSKVTFIRYYMPNTLGTYDKFKLDVKDTWRQIKRYLGVKK